VTDNRFRELDEDDIIAEMGWNDETMLIHMRGFIHALKQDQLFRDYLADVAYEEELDCKSLETE
jgi:hypothetical protein